MKLGENYCPKPSFYKVINKNTNVKNVFSGDQINYAKNHAPMKEILEVIKTVKPNVLIGEHF